MDEQVVSSTVVGPVGDQLRLSIGRVGTSYRVHEQDVQTSHRWVTSGPFASIAEARSYRDALIAAATGPVVVEALTDPQYHELFDLLCRLAVQVPTDGPVDADMLAEITAAQRQTYQWRTDLTDFDTAQAEVNQRIVTIQGMLATIRRRARRPLQCNECGARFNWEDGTEDWEPGQPVDYICQTCPVCFGSDVEPRAV